MWDRQTLLEQLARAEGYIAKGEQILSGHRDRMHSRARFTGEAARLLETLEKAQAMLMLRRKQLCRGLADLPR